MKKKMLSIVSLALMLSVVPVSANAIYTETDYNEKYVNYIELKDSDIDIIHPNVFNNTHFDNFYLKKDGSEMIFTQNLPEVIYFNPTEGTTLEKIRELINSDIEEGKSAYHVEARAYRGNFPEFKYAIRTSNGISDNEAKVLCEILKTNQMIDSFYLTKDRRSETFLYAPCLTTYYTPGDQLTVLEEYIKNKNLDFSIAGIYTYSSGDTTGEENDDIYYLLPNDDISIYECLDIAKNIVNDIGIYPCYMSPAEVNQSDLSNLIDVFNSLKGDANCDGEINMADAVLIMQAVTNPDEYGVGKDKGITVQGSFNSDVCNPGSGVTLSDALAIQRQLLNS